MSSLIVESSDRGVEPGLPADTSDLVAFLSFAVAERYGSVHALSAAANLLRKRQKIDLRPLLEFDNAEPDDDLDRQTLARLWQAPAPVAAAATAVASAIRSDPQLASLTADFPALPALLHELAAVADTAAARGVQIRLTYRL